MVKGIVVKIGKYIVTFLVIFIVLLLLIVGVACLPKAKLKKHFQESANFMTEHDTVTLVHDFALSSKLDYYADCITLSIAYYLDEDRPLISSMWTSYYGENSNVMNEYFRESVETDIQPNHEYLRYWHGSAAAIRFLHLFWSIRTIYIFHAVLIASLLLLLTVVLIKHNLKAEAFALIISMIGVAVWFVPWCLEYTYSFLCMLVTGIFGTFLALRKKEQWIGPLFMISGILTVYFDFLTTETLSLLIPLLLVLRIQRKDKSDRDLWNTILKCCVAWGIGYLGMWIMKWLLASAVLQINVLPYVKEHISERLNGKVTGYYITGNFYLDTLVKNIRCLFPLEYGVYGAVIVVALIIGKIVLPVSLRKATLRNRIDVKHLAIYAAVGLIPYIRYLVLSNHSYVHYFFTYRAQAATLMAICFIILEFVQRAPQKGEKQNA